MRNIIEEITQNNHEQGLDYLAVSNEQEEAEKFVGHLLQQFMKSECITIHRHYEGRIHSTGNKVWI